LLDDPSPLVRGAAVWALSKLTPQKVTQLSRNDEDPGVNEEWRLALAAT
jgi:epoxyqueuosine reductase